MYSILPACQSSSSLCATCRDLLLFKAESHLTHAMQLTLPHHFTPHTYFSPSFCFICGVLLKGIIKQGQQCNGVC